MTSRDHASTSLPKQSDSRDLDKQVEQESLPAYPRLAPAKHLLMFGKQEILRLQNTIGNRAIERMLANKKERQFYTHTDSASRGVRGSQSSMNKSLLQRKKGGGESTGSATGDVGVAGGESATPSDQDVLAKGYELRDDGSYTTPYGRVVQKDQAVAESRVINSAGIFMGAYLARYNALKRFSLSQEDLDKLSADAGFMQQFQTGDVVLRMMDAEDSAALAKITNSNYSHSGIIQKNGGRVWILDSYPGRKLAADQGIGQDSTQLIRFEDFFGDHGKEKIVQGLVLRIDGLVDTIRQKINDLINFYNKQPTTFDYEFKVDNDRFALYCSELVWRILSEANSPVLPPNEFVAAKKHAAELLDSLRALIAFQKSQGTDTTKAEQQLQQLSELVQKFDTATAEELYSPGSLERTKGLTSIAGFTREGKIEGLFKVIVIDGSAPDSMVDTPDCYVKLKGGLLGGGSQTTVKADTTTPAWNEVITTLDFDALQNVSLELWDEDVLSDDLLATFGADLRPVKPSGQIFTVRAAESSLRIKVEAENSSQAVQAPRQEAS